VTRTALIVGASRTLGLALATEYLHLGWDVIAGTGSWHPPGYQGCGQLASIEARRRSCEPGWVGQPT
jgi:NAD(P)-dependent dehydrogenase (short-subunit alcohol dehydrogenase family)